jgi:hypothetical protein
MANCLETLDFSQRLYSQQWDASNVKRGRALIAVLCISKRIKDICETDEPSPLVASEALSRTEELVRVACCQWSSTEEMRNTVCEMHPLLKRVVANTLCCGLDNQTMSDNEVLFNALHTHGKPPEKENSQV